MMIAVTFRAADWSAWIFLAFLAGLIAAFIAQPQGAGCLGFGCLGNIVVGGIGAIIGNFIVGRFYRGEVNVVLAFLISLAGALLVLYVGQGIDRFLRRNAPPEETASPSSPMIVDSTAREAARDEDER